ncbi:hypothetical protein D6789_04705 [Candidatus Woesearchaeota archaeon]|nr:MAG: hypothetical protein D6789_04705 [Candidatus Woesearchaeota archaeon]
MLKNSIHVTVGGRMLGFSPAGILPLVEQFITDYEATNDDSWLRLLQGAIGETVDEVPTLAELYRGEHIPQEEVRQLGLLISLYERLETVLTWQAELSVPRFMRKRSFSTRQPFALTGKVRGRPGFNSYSYRVRRGPSGRLRSWLVFHEVPLAQLLDSYALGQAAYIIKGYPRELFHPGLEQSLTARLAHEYVSIHRALRQSGTKAPVYPVHETLLRNS